MGKNRLVLLQNLAGSDVPDLIDEVIIVLLLSSLLSYHGCLVEMKSFSFSQKELNF